MIQAWRLDDKRQTLVLGARDGRLAEVIYWGGRLPDGEDLSSLYSAHELDVTGGMLDVNPELSICPEASRTFPGQVGLVANSLDGTKIVSKFQFTEAKQNQDSLELIYDDAKNGLTYTARFAVNGETNMLSAQAYLDSREPINVQWFAAPVLPASQQSAEMIDFSGRWCSEFQANMVPWTAGAHVRDNPTGRTGHEHFPGLVVPNAGATNNAGSARAFHYGWSGGHKMVAEELSDGRRQIQFGHASGTYPVAQTQFGTAKLYFTFSDEGINGCATSFQRYVRDQVVKFPDPKRQRPVHYNCWEAVYFDHSLNELKEIASHAARLGAERFVLDDGWFGKRDDDTTSLGDWQIDKRKYPNGLTPLIDHIHSLGMTFGIWFEPEMVNKESNVYRAHPEWVLGDDDQILGRQQNVLNMDLPEVREYLFDAISKVLSESSVDYIKWDHNRVLPISDASQVMGTYALLDQLRAAHPSVEIESCSSGGGRIDVGVLERTHRVWLSDSNDAFERLKIQHNAALFLPACVTGSHVGPRTCHTSGRTMDMRLRAWTAAQRHMGFEMDPRELTDEEAQILTAATSWWKQNREWMMLADILRLDALDDAIVAEQHMSADKSRFVVFAGKIAASDQILPRPLALARLDESAKYEIDLINRDDVVGLSRGSTAIERGKVTLSGAYLKNHGLNLPWSFPDTMWVLEGRRVND